MKLHIRYLLPLLLTAYWGCSMMEAGDNIGGLPAEGAEDYTAIVSVRISPTDTVYFQVDDQTRLFPVGDQAPYRGLERILCGVRVYGETIPNYGFPAQVFWFDSLDKGVMTADASVQGEDPVWIISDWMTSCEDGFLTLHYEAWWGELTVPHGLYLVSGLNPGDPYELWLRHDAKGDGRLRKDDALVYFDLQSLPDTGDSAATLTLKWKNGEGQVAEKQFAYRTRRGQ